MRTTLFRSILLTVAVLLMATTSWAKEFRYEYQKVIDTDGEAGIELICFNGDIEITGSTGDQIVIEAVKKVRAASMIEAQQVADHIEIKAKPDGNNVKVEAVYHRMHDRSESFWKRIMGVGGSDSFGDVDWSIQVPKDCHVNITNTGGQISVSHLIGDVEIRTTSGNVELVSIEGEVEVDNSAGSTIGELLFGSVTVKQNQGRVRLRFVEGDVRVKSMTADIYVLQEAGSFDLISTSGHITAQTNLDSPKDYFVATESGDITLSIPETSSGNLRIKSRTGEIAIDVPVSIKTMSQREVEGSFGYGGAEIDLTSTSGDVTIAEF